MQVLRHPIAYRLRSILFGGRARHGVVPSAVLYAVLFAIGFV